MNNCSRQFADATYLKHVSFSLFHSIPDPGLLTLPDIAPVSLATLQHQLRQQLALYTLHMIG